MSDTELSPAEDARLRLLLQRAADGVEVPTVPALPATVTPLRPTRRRAPWVLAGAAVLALVAGGLWMASGDGGDDRVDSGPATEVPEDTALPLQDIRDIWVLPEDGPRAPTVVDAIAYTESTLTFWIAVDDPTDPTRWMAITPTGMAPPTSATEGGSGGGSSRPDGSTVTIVDSPPLADGSRWAQLTGPNRTGYLSVAYSGVEDAEVLDQLYRIVQELAARDTNLTDVAALELALDAWVPPAGLQPTWLTGRGWSNDQPQLSLLVETADGTELVVHSIRTGLPPAVAALELKFTLPGGLEDPSQISFEELPELGPGAFAAVRAGQRSLYLFSPDGVRVTVAENEGTIGTDPTALVEVARGLRPTTESGLGRELAARGVELRTIDPSATSPSPEITTTTTG